MGVPAGSPADRLIPLVDDVEEFFCHQAAEGWANPPAARLFFGTIFRVFRGIPS